MSQRHCVPMKLSASGKLIDISLKLPMRYTCIYIGMDGSMDGSMDGWIDRSMDRWMDGIYMHILHTLLIHIIDYTIYLDTVNQLMSSTDLLFKY